MQLSNTFLKNVLPKYNLVICMSTYPSDDFYAEHDSAICNRSQGFSLNIVHLTMIGLGWNLQ
jgi:hypothetical protein